MAEIQRLSAWTRCNQANIGIFALIYHGRIGWRSVLYEMNFPQTGPGAQVFCNTRCQLTANHDESRVAELWSKLFRDRSETMTVFPTSTWIHIVCILYIMQYWSGSQCIGIGKGEMWSDVAAAQKLDCAAFRTRWNETIVLCNIIEQGLNGSPLVSLFFCTVTLR